MAYADYYRTEPERPVIVTVVGILGIVAGALALLSLPVSLVQLSGSLPGSQFMQEPTVRNWSIVASTVGTVLGVLGLVAGIGLLAMRRWAWLLAIGTLVAGALWQIVSAIAMQSLDIMGKMFANMGMSANPNMAAMMQRMTGVITIFGLIFWLAVYATVLILLTLPNIRQAFADR